MADIDLDEIRKQVAIKHGVVLDKDDPILATVMLNEMILEHYLNLVSDQHEKANQELTTTLQRQIEQSKKIAERIINDTATHTSNQARQAIISAITDAGMQLRQQTVEGIANSKKARVYKNRAYVAAILSGIGAITIVITLTIALLVK